jgi:hypothetical protein
MALTTAQPCTHSIPASLTPTLELSIITGMPEVPAESAV